MNYFSQEKLCDNIIQFHALRGCDTTSYFYGVGKIKSFQNNYEKQKYNRAYLEFRKFSLS